MHIYLKNDFGSPVVLFSITIVTMVTSILHSVVTSDKLIVAEKPNPAISPVLLCEVLLWQAVQGLSWEDIISRLRSRTVPPGYPYHAWKPGTLLQHFNKTLC